MIDDMKWLLEIVKKAPDIKFLEPSMQSLGLLFAYTENSFETEDLLILSLAGHIATLARISDNEKFSEIRPEVYFELAQYFVDTQYKDTEATENNFSDFLSRLKELRINK
jgi:hypothetical protein